MLVVPIIENTPLEKDLEVSFNCTKLSICFAENFKRQRVVWLEALCHDIAVSQKV